MFGDYSAGFENRLAAPQGDAENTAALGLILYDKYIMLFQLAGLILLVAMIGAIVLTLRHRTNVKRQNVVHQMSRDAAKAMELKDIKPGRPMKLASLTFLMLCPLSALADIAQCDRPTMAHHAGEYDNRDLGTGVVSHTNFVSIVHDGVGGSSEWLNVISCGSGHTIRIGFPVRLWKRIRRRARRRGLQDLV